MLARSKSLVGVVAGLFCLLAIAGPANSQVGSPPTADEVAACPTSGTGAIGGFSSCRDLLCFLNPDAAYATYPYCLYEFVLPPGCHPASFDGLFGAPGPNLSPPFATQPECGANALFGHHLPDGCDPQATATFPQAECVGIESGALPPGCDPNETGPAFPQPACYAAVIAALNGLCELLGPAGTFPDCLDTSAADPNELCAVINDGVAGTFPDCIETPGADPNELCAVINDGVAGTFPDCIDISAADPNALCAVVNQGAAGTFPDCVDPSGPDLNALCAVINGGTAGTFPDCVDTGADPNALCAVANQGAAGTFPECVLVPGADPNALCAVVNQGAAGTFPDCLDISGADPNELCGLVPDAYGETFPDCLTDEPPANIAPAANAGPDQSVDEGDLVTLAGSGSDADGDSLTYSWSCMPAVTLSSTNDPAATFTAPQVAGPSPEVIVCTLTVSDGQAQSTDSVDIAVADVPAPGLAIDLEFDTLARQLPDNHIGIDGMATASEAVQDVGLNFIVKPGQATTGALCTQSAITWASPDDPDAGESDLAGGVGEEFSIDVCWTEEESVVFEVAAIAGDQEFPIEITITFDSSATDVRVEVEDVAAVGNEPLVLSNATYFPNGSTDSLVSTTFRVKDRNGNGDGSGAYGRINDTRVSGSISRLSQSAPAVIGTAANVPGSATERDFPMRYNLPPNLKDGLYVVEAVYDNGETGDVVKSATLQVPNREPSIELWAGAGFVNGSQRISGTSPQIHVTLRDANIGALSPATAVTELTSFRVGFHDASDCTGAPASTTGLGVIFSGVVPGASPGAMAVNYTAAQLTGGRTNLTVAISWAQTTPADVYYLCGSVMDDSGASSGDVLLGSLVLNALNRGFHLTIDDGGNGLSAGSVEPGEGANTEALRVVLSGTRNATSLAFALGDFDGPDDLTIDVGDVALTGTLCLYLNATGTGCKNAAGTLALGVAAVDGTVTFEVAEGNLLENLDAGIPYFAFFAFNVPEGTGAGSYRSTVTVSGLPG